MKKSVKILKQFQATGLSGSQKIALFSELPWNFQNNFCLAQIPTEWGYYKNSTKFYEKAENFDMAELDSTYHSLCKV